MSRDLIRQNKVSGGMILKLEACKRALSAGVPQVRIVGGSVPRGLLSAANGARFPGHARHLSFIRRKAPHGRGAVKSHEKKNGEREASSLAARDSSRRTLATLDEHVQAAPT